MLEKIQKYETELWTVLCVLFFNIIAHGYRFVNLMFNGDSLLIYQTDQNWKYSIGRIFQPFYWKLRGDLVAPMLIATLAVFYFTAALVLIVRMFNSGLWKVYGDEAYARAAFAKYKKCTDIYCRSWRSGASLEALTVAG